MQILGSRCRRPSPGRSGSEADESSSAKEAVSAREAALGSGEEGWRDVPIDLKSSGAAFRLVGLFQLCPDVDKQKATKPGEWNSLKRVPDTGLPDRVVPARTMNSR